MCVITPFSVSFGKFQTFRSPSKLIFVKVIFGCNRVKRGRFAALRRPMLVRGPLGVLSATELIFLLLFIALLTWSFAYINTQIPIVQNMNPRQIRRHLNDAIWQKKLRSSGFFMATVGNVCSALLFYPVTRGSSILPLLGLTPDGSIKYHMWIGNLALFFFTAHSATFIIYWALTDDLVEMLKWDKHSVANVPGELAAILGIVLWVTVHPGIRRKMFELFFYTHHLYIPFMFFYMLHTGFSFFCMILPGFYLFLVDRYLRFLQSRRKVRLVSARILPCKTVELNFSKSPTLMYTPTSFVSINVPSISSMQWHPFSVTSNCSLEPDVLTVIVKKNGNWSQKLYETLASPSLVDRLEVAIEGPYGPVSADFLRYKTLVMVSGGSGISPITSIIRELIFRKVNIGCPTPLVILICAFRHSEDLTMLDLTLPFNGCSKDISPFHIEIEAFVTRDKVPVWTTNNLVKTIWFKPHPSDEPLSPTLGSHCWFWLGAIISSSFAMFLVIIGLLGRYYIYPKDQNSNKVYSWTVRTSLNALCICVSIFASATTAVVWNKRSYAMEGKSVQTLELASPTNSPNARFYIANQERESLPEQSITQNTRVHYGSRPNLKKMLLENDGSSTGVLVCGPAQMRHEVAKICASGLADNLHYESISFSS
ncbi:ferric reduction oxidase 2-like [Aristolochia californica]|uniref:ferric reduction oxidase 2-like n=1 Tax=Aristolochia californica TaxID=171875 RepID=UPI0035DFA473